MFVYSVGRRFTLCEDGIFLSGEVVDIRFNKNYCGQPDILLKFDIGFSQWYFANYTPVFIFQDEF